jgi:hypothetical protein
MEYRDVHRTLNSWHLYSECYAEYPVVQIIHVEREAMYEILESIVYRKGFG